MSRILIILLFFMKAGLSQDTLFVNNDLDGEYKYFKYRDSLEHWKKHTWVYNEFKNYDGNTYYGWSIEGSNCPQKLKDLYSNFNGDYFSVESCVPTRRTQKVAVITLIRCKYEMSAEHPDGCITPVEWYSVNVCGQKPKMVIAQKKEYKQKVMYIREITPLKSKVVSIVNRNQDTLYRRKLSILVNNPY